MAEVPRIELDSQPATSAFDVKACPAESGGFEIVCGDVRAPNFVIE